MLGSFQKMPAKEAIYSSWRRCERDYNLKRDAAHPILRLQSAEIAPRLEAMIERTGGRQGIFSTLARIAADAGHCLVITDKEGILVRLESKEAEQDWNGIGIGSVWDERIAGTNGVSMALTEERAFTVRSGEHFYARLQPFACTAVPLRDADNRIIGVANLSSIDRGDPASSLFAQEILGAAASRVQHILFERQFKDTMIVSVAVPGRRNLIKGAEFVAVDERGTILGATADAHTLSGLGAHTELIGTRFDAVFGADTNSLDRLPDRVMSVRRDRGPLLDLWARTPVNRAKAFPGWRRRPQRPLRRRLPPSLKTLAIGSRTMAAMCERARNSLAHGLPLLVEGETGTGKSALVASLIGGADHSVTVDCAVLDDTEENRFYIRSLMQQTRLAGEMDTGTPHGATVVFDNIDEMPAFAQSALRSVLDDFEMQIGAVGSRAQIIATTRRPLSPKVAEGGLRDDLFYMLSGAAITLPPLRERERPDALAEHLAQDIAGHAIEFSHDARKAIAAHDWPGNLRELRNAVQQALMNGDGAQITALDLALVAQLAPCVCRRRVEQPVFDEAQVILDALQGARWNVSKAARTLHMGRATIHRKMKTFGISRPVRSG